VKVYWLPIVSAQAVPISAKGRAELEERDGRFAIRLSLMFGLLMLIGKTAAYFMTHSAAIFSDAAESVIHVIAVGFAAFSLRLSTKPASSEFLYGFERITFFSAGFEGALIVVAAITILFESIRKWLSGLQMENLGAGVLLILMVEYSTQASAIISCGSAGGPIQLFSKQMANTY